VCLLGVGCASKHAGPSPRMDSGADGSGEPQAGADVATAGVAPGCEIQPAKVDADSGAVTLDCRCKISDHAVVTIYDSTTATVPTCTFALPPYDHAEAEFAIYFNNSLIGTSRVFSTDLTVSADNTAITLTGSSCTDIENRAPSLVQAIFGCIVPPLGGP
jgi:hypothetical protein